LLAFRSDCEPGSDYRFLQGINELREYEWLFDDCVIALALANSKRYAFEGPGNLLIYQPAPKVARLWARGRVLAG
jgi:hypothetical protein